MKSVSISFLLLAILLLLTVIVMKLVEGFSCLATKLSLSSCLPFLTTNVDTTSTTCCNAFSHLKALAQTKPEFCAACDCLVRGATSIPNLDKDKAVKLPKRCNIDVGFPITKDFNYSM